MLLVLNLIIMSHKGITPEFVDQLSKQFQLLQQHSALQGQDLLTDLSSTVELLRTEHQHDARTGVPPPKDQEIHSDSSETPDSPLNSHVEEVSEEAIHYIRQKNNVMKQEIQHTLLAFRTANEEFMRTEALGSAVWGDLHSQIADLNEESQHPGSALPDELLERISDLQAGIERTNAQMISSESQIMTKEIENLELRHRISQLERNNKQSSSHLCQCLIV